MRRSIQIDVDASLTLQHGDATVDVHGVGDRISFDVRRVRDLPKMWKFRNERDRLVHWTRALGLRGEVRCKGLPLYRWS